MKPSPRLIVAASIGCAVLIALPPAFSMDIMERIVTTQTQSIRREASEYQRKVAEANARAYMAKQLHAVRHDSTAGPTSKPGKTGKTGKTAKQEDTPEVRAAKKKLPRYIAVETPKDKRSVPGTKKDVMIWDTQSEALVGNYVYDVTETPRLGSTSKFETYSAQYVGNGQ
ncbi:MAG: hypothetical protein ABJF10_26760 [Chthoniobacter sp.]|uniref:hypothetical protein n=1 Tax=Chthoniobacter sp. TaxID=2510640 RepID=UPI0032A1E0A6